MPSSEKEALIENAKALKKAVIDGDVDEAVYLLKRSGSAKDARALAQAAQDLPNSIVYLHGVSYSVLVEGEKETIMLYKFGQYVALPVAGITFSSS